MSKGNLTSNSMTSCTSLSRKSRLADPPRKQTLRSGVYWTSTTFVFVNEFQSFKILLTIKLFNDTEGSTQSMLKIISGIKAQFPAKREKIDFDVYSLVPRALCHIGTETPYLLPNIKNGPVDEVTLFQECCIGSLFCYQNCFQNILGDLSHELASQALFSWE